MLPFLSRKRLCGCHLQCCHMVRGLLALCLLALLGLVLLVHLNPVAQSLTTPRILDGGFFRLLIMLTTSQAFDLPPQGEMGGHPISENALRQYLRSLSSILKTLELKRAKMQQQREATALHTSHLTRTFSPSLTTEEHALLLLTMSVLLETCRKAELVILAAKGTLLGAYRHHGLIPWDDDVDFFIKASQWRQARLSLSHVPGFSIQARPSTLWKFFAQGDWVTNVSYIPSVDIFFFAEDETHLWSHTWMSIGFLMAPKCEVFPLRPLPFDGIEIPGPCNLEKAVTRIFDVESCHSNIYSHKMGKFHWVEARSQPCSLLSPVFPFVQRRLSLKEGYQQEILKIGNTSLHMLTVPLPQLACKKCSK